MKTLCLLRHAKAAQARPGERDFDRPLTERGRRDCARLGPVLRELRPDLIVLSSAQRTRETWQTCAEGQSFQPEIWIESALYLCSAETLVTHVREIPETYHSVIVVAHNPTLHEVALWLSGDDETAPGRALQIKFPTGAAAIFSIESEWQSLSPASAVLTRFVVGAELG